MDRQTKLALLKTTRLLLLVSEVRKKAEENLDERVQKVREDHLKEFAEAEEEVLEVAVPFFKRQIESTLKNLEERAENDQLVSTEAIFDVTEWTVELKNEMFPTFARITAQAMLNELERDGVDLSVMMKKEKASTATEWLENHPQEGLESTTFRTEEGLISMGFLSEYPSWMKRDIRELLEESFSQKYWEEVSKTTYSDINSILQEGARDGWSIDTIARKLSTELFEDGEYALRRGRLLARTELGHALNGARSRSMDALKEEVGEEVPMLKQWHSVLGPTTRDTHAWLDGTPENSEGMWYLGGTWCRWPGDVVLPARERCNCQCTIIMVFGMQNDRALQLIGEYSQRIGMKTIKIRRIKSYASSSHIC